MVECKGASLHRLLSKLSTEMFDFSSCQYRRIITAGMLGLLLTISPSRILAQSNNVYSRNECSGFFNQVSAWTGNKNCGSKPPEATVSPKQSSNKPPLVDSMPVGSIQPQVIQNPPSKPLKPLGPQTLAGIVDSAISDHPQIGMQVERLNEVRFAIKTLEAGKRPQLEARVAGGHAATGSKPTDTSLFGTSELASAARVDGTLSLKQLVYDFDGLKNDILKTEKLLTSEEYKTIEKTEEISYKVVQAYLKIIESREMLAAAEQNVAALHKIAKLVESNAKDGNGTLADVKRVSARKVEGETLRTDLRTEMLLATDQFRRLARAEPGRLATAPNLSKSIPQNKDLAIAMANDNHPRILSISAQNSSMENELASQKSVAKPKIQAEAESAAKNYMGPGPRTEVDLRAMVAMRYKLYDGGANAAQVEQVKSRMIQGDLRHRYEKEEIEADLRQFYNSLSASRSKISNLRSGLDSNTKVTALYIEQFLGGKRTLFELLDSQQALYMARRAVIQNQFEERRSTYGILRSMGMLTRTLLNNERHKPAAPLQMSSKTAVKKQALPLKAL